MLVLFYEVVNFIVLSEDESSVVYSCLINYGLLFDGL